MRLVLDVGAGGGRRRRLLGLPDDAGAVVSFLHALVVALFALLASWADQPAPAVQTHPAPAVVAPAAPGVVAPPAAPTVAAPPPAAEQLAGEAIGGARCGDTAQVVVAIADDGHYVCG